MNLLLTYAVDTLEPYFKWITIGILIALIVVGAIMFFVNKDGFNKYVKIAFFAFLVYALVFGAVMLILDIVKHYNYAYLEEKWVSKEVIRFVLIPSLITLVLVLGAAITLFVLDKKGSDKLKPVTYIFGCVLAVAVLVTLILIAVYFARNINGDGYYTGDYGKLNSPVLYVTAIVLVIAMILAAFILGKGDDNKFDTRCIALAGITVALSFVLSYVKLFQMPQGGAITFVSMFPVMLFAFIYGPKKGILIGFIYGMLQGIQDPYIIHPAQFLLDYPVAFMSVGFAGAFNKIAKLDNLPQVKFLLGGIIVSALRFFAHLLSGVFAFGAYASDAGASNLWAYSAAYNSFVFIEVLLVVVVGVIVLSSKTFVKKVVEYKK